MPVRERSCWGSRRVVVIRLPPYEILAGAHRFSETHSSAPTSLVAAREVLGFGTSVLGSADTANRTFVPGARNPQLP
jgi:hypothetical protein